MFTREQFVEWFSLEAVSRSPAKFNPEKLLWLNQQYIKQADDARLAVLARPFLERDGCDLTKGPKLEAVIALVKDRGDTIIKLADAAVYFYKVLHPTEDLRKQHYTAEILPAMMQLREKFAIATWERQALGAVIKEVLAAHNLKMPKLAIPLRVMLTGETHTPSIDAVLELIGRDEVLARMDAEMGRIPG
jgi:glutamyl-tRNA synthetase